MPTRAGAEQRDESRRPCATKTRDVAEKLVDATIGERVNEEAAAEVRGEADRVGTGDGAGAELRRRRRVQRDHVAFRIRRVECGTKSRDRRHAVVSRGIEAI